MIMKNNNSKKLLIAICFSAFFLSCSSDDNTWDTTIENDDIISYKYYVAKYPEGKHIEKARSLIDEIMSGKGNKLPILPDKIIPPISIWNNKIIDNLSLKVSISAPQLKESQSEYESKYYDLIKNTLEKIGINVVPQNTKQNTTLKMNATVKALSSNYTNFGTLYSGYRIKGDISLTSDGEIPITLSIKNEKPCEQWLSLTEKSAQQMKNPRQQLNIGSPEKFIWDFLYKVWGLSPVVWLDIKNNSFSKDLGKDFKGELSNALVNNIIRGCYSDNFSIRESAINYFLHNRLYEDHTIAIPIILYNIKREEFLHGNFPVSKKSPGGTGSLLNYQIVTLLSFMGQDAIEATPNFIQYAELRNKVYNPAKEPERQNYIRILKQITGQDFNDDFESWIEWWFNNKKLLLDD